MLLSQYTKNLLDDIERRISPEVEDEFLGQWEKFWAGEHSDIIFSPKRKEVSAPAVEVKPININDALEDYELMLDSELVRVSRALETGEGALAIRANYGTGIIPSLFGAKIFTMPREQNILPTSIPFGDEDSIRRIIDGGVPSLDIGFGGKVFEYGEMCREIFENYPKIAKYLPTTITDGNSLIYGLKTAEDYIGALIASIASCIVCFTLGFMLWEKRKL